MASATERTDAIYTLYGFGTDLDWRQTCFLEPLPPSRCCAYCGRVCATMMMLPCCHIVCASCYKQCTRRNNACVLDAQRFRLHDAAAIVYTAQDLASRHIRCWNVDRGCYIAGPSFQIVEHYRKDCQYHSISCVRCGKAVTHGDVVAHLAQGCSPDTSLRHLPPHTKHVSLEGAKETENQLEGQNLAASPFPGGADQDLSPTHNQRANLERTEASSERLEVIKPPHRETDTFSQTLQPEHVTGQDEPSSSRREVQSLTDDNYKPPVVESGEHQQLPSTSRSESAENKLSASPGKEMLGVIKDACGDLEPGKATGLDEPSSSRRAAQAPADNSCKPPVVESDVCQQLPRTSRPDSVENNISATGCKHTLVVIKKACVHLGDVMKEGLENVCSLTKPSLATAEEANVSSSEISSAIVETAQQGSTQYPDKPATEGVGTPCVLQQQGSSGSATSVVTLETGTAPEDLASSGTEKQTTTTQGDYKADREGKCEPLEGQPATTDSAAPSHDEFESGFNPQGSAGGDGRQATTSDVSNPTVQTSTSGSPIEEALLLLLSGYVNSVNHFLRAIFEGIDNVYDALEELEPEDLAFVLNSCQELRVRMKEECLTWGAMRDQIQQEVAKVFHDVRRQVHIMSDEDLFQDPVGKKIDRLMNMGKHVLRERIRDSVPVQWHLDRWSELKARAVATGKAADYFSGIRATFFGYFIVPGLLLEKTASKLLLRCSFYVRKGDFDDFLEWPIEKEFTLSILHPTDKEKVRSLVVDTRVGQTERYTRPGNETREPISSNKTLKANFIDVNGFVEGDRLLLQFEVKECLAAK